jgi:O-antigen ligase
MMAISFLIGTFFIVIDIFINLIQKRKINFTLGKIEIFFSLLLLSMLVSQLVVDSVHGVHENFFAIISYAYKNYFQWFWLIYFFQNLDFKRDFIFVKDDFWTIKNVILFIVAFASLITAFYVLFQLIGIVNLSEKGHFGFLSQPYTSSGVVLAGIFSSIYFYIHKQKQKNLISTVILLQVISLFLLGQVSACFGLVLGFLLINIKQRVVGFKFIFSLTLVTLLVLVIAAQSVPRLQRKLSWFTSIEKLTNNKSIRCRLSLWQENFLDFENKWLFGRKEIKNFDCVTKDKINSLEHAHNIFLQQLFTGGIFKLAIWLVFYLSLFFFLIKTYSENQVFLGYFLALFFEGLLEYWWGDSEVRNIFLIMMFCALLATRIPKRS